MSATAATVNFIHACSRPELGYYWRYPVDGAYLDPTRRVHTQAQIAGCGLLHGEDRILECLRNLFGLGYISRLAAALGCHVVQQFDTPVLFRAYAKSRNRYARHTCLGRQL